MPFTFSPFLDRLFFHINSTRHNLMLIKFKLKLNSSQINQIISKFKQEIDDEYQFFRLDDSNKTKFASKSNSNNRKMKNVVSKFKFRPKFMTKPDFLRRRNSNIKIEFFLRHYHNSINKPNEKEMHLENYCCITILPKRFIKHNCMSPIMRVW